MLFFLKFCPECLCVRHSRFSLGTNKYTENGRNKVSRCLASLTTVGANVHVECRLEVILKKF